jgi:hypothetical protein
MIDNGRRIGSDSSQVICAKLPGFAAAAHFGARTRMMNWSPGNAVEEITSPSSTKIVFRFFCAAR